MRPVRILVFHGVHVMATGRQRETCEVASTLGNLPSPRITGRSRSVAAPDMVPRDPRMDRKTASNRRL